MCVGFWTLTHPDFALILCSNRDEFLARPTTPVHWHSFGPIATQDHQQGTVLSGRDSLAGGTWAGLTRDGRIALLFVTNITEPFRKYASSRGDLTHSFLLPKTPYATLEAEIDAFLDENRDRAYAGFNLLVLSPSYSPGDLGPRALSYHGAFLTNSGGGRTISARMLSEQERRCGGMSNGVDHDGADDWPKVQHGRQALEDVLNTLPQDATENEIADRLFSLLTWTSPQAPTARSELRNTIQVEPITMNLPSLLPVPAADGGKNVHDGTPPTTGYYGTRVSTVILVRRSGHATFIERDVWTLSDEDEEYNGSSADPTINTDNPAESPWHSHSQHGNGNNSNSNNNNINIDNNGNSSSTVTPRRPVKRDSGHDRVFRFEIEAWNPQPEKNEIITIGSSVAVPPELESHQ